MDANTERELVFSLNEMLLYAKAYAEPALSGHGDVYYAFLAAEARAREALANLSKKKSRGKQ